MEEDKKLHGVFACLLNGFHDRGEGGVAYVDGENVAYLFPREFRGVPDGFVDTLDAMLAGDEGKKAFFVIEKKQNKLDVLAYPRTRVVQEAVKSVT